MPRPWRVERAPAGAAAPPECRAIDLASQKELQRKAPDQHQVILNDRPGSGSDIGFVEVIVLDQHPHRQTIRGASTEPRRAEFPLARDRSSDRHDRAAAPCFPEIETKWRSLARKTAAVWIDARAGDHIAELECCHEVRGFVK